MFLLVLGPALGLALGAGVAGDYFPQHRVVAGIAGGLLGAPVGLGLVQLHARALMWLLRPDLPEDESGPTGLVAKFCCGLVYGLSMLWGTFLSFACVLMTIGFLLKRGPFKPGQLSREQCLAIFSSVALLGYLQAAFVHRLVVRMVSPRKL